MITKEWMQRAIIRLKVSTAISVVTGIAAIALPGHPNVIAFWIMIAINACLLVHAAWVYRKVKKWMLQNATI
jgi:uncharacterized membrane protein YgaE (UPF0421/DUF939 family)